MRMRLATVAMLAALAGCALPVALEDGPESAVRESLQALQATPAEQATAVRRARERFRQSPSPENRLRLASLLATLAAPLGDDARAAELLQPLADPSGGASARYAAFLLEQLVQRRRLAQEADRLGREADRLGKEVERATREREKAQKDYAAAEKERDKREEAMRQQIEALRAIERGILEREERRRTRPR